MNEERLRQHVAQAHGIDRPGWPRILVDTLHKNDHGSGAFEHPADDLYLAIDEDIPTKEFTIVVRANVFDPTVTATDIAQWLHDEAVAFPSAQYEEDDLRFDITDVSAS